MQTSPQPILAAQIERLMISDADRERLLEELRGLSDEKLKDFTDLIREHDEEALKILDEKSTEQLKVKDHLREASPAKPKHVTKEQAIGMIDFLEKLFQQPKALAHFLALADDTFLMQLENIFLENLKNDSGAREEFKRFFSEVRLQKAALAQKWKKEDRKIMIEEILRNQKYSAQLDKLIKEGEKILQKNKN